MAATIPRRKVYKFRMEPTGLEAPELERAASVARAFERLRCQELSSQ